MGLGREPRGAIGWRSAASILAACAALLIVVPFASADIFKGGLGSHRTGAVLITNAQGNPKTIKLGPWRADCKRRGESWHSNTIAGKPFDQATKTSLRETGSYTQPDRPFSGRVHASITATKKSANRWSGKLRAKIKVSKHGRSYDTCSTGVLRFNVHRRGNGHSAPGPVANGAGRRFGLIP